MKVNVGMALWQLLQGQANGVEDGLRVLCQGLAHHLPRQLDGQCHQLLGHLMVDAGQRLFELFGQPSQAGSFGFGLRLAFGITLLTACGVALGPAFLATFFHRCCTDVLVHALDVCGIDPAGLVALDLGASTGGFTEVCLDRGAARVFAVDVGFGQMHHRVAGDLRVANLERTDARDLNPEVIPQAPSLIVCDASFISLSKVLPAALALAAGDADLVTLVKPQFEADGPGGGGKKGVVKDPQAHVAAVQRVSDWLESVGWTVQATTESPITGGDGNVEFLLWAKRASSSATAR